MTQYLVEKHDVALFCPVGNVFSMDAVEFEKKNGEMVTVPMYPGTGGDMYGEDVIGYHYDDFNADIMLQLADIWMLNKIPEMARSGKIKWIAYVPVDYLDPIPKKVLDTLRSAFKVVPWCDDAYNRLIAAGLSNVLPPIPLGLNCKLWVPLEEFPSDKGRPAEMRDFPETMKAMGYEEDAFNILIANANQFFRKSFSESLSGIAMFRDRRPDAKIRLYLHTPVTSADGWNMPELVETYGLQNITKGMDTYQFILGKYDQSTMVKIFALSSVCINTGLEGFGFATLQSQAVGVPCIGLNAGPTPEIVKYGVLVEPRTQLMTPSMQVNAFPHARDIADALETIYDNPSNKFSQQRRETIDWVRKTFDWDVVMKKWDSHLSLIEEELYRKCIWKNPPKPSERSLAMAEGIRVID